MVGKSVLCAQVVRHLQAEKKSTVAFFICNFRRNDLNTCSHFLRVIAAQLVKKNQAFVGLVYDDYVMQGLTPSKRYLKPLIQTLLSGLPSTRIIVDGLDECTDEEQKEILSAISKLVDMNTNSTACKGAIFSRDVAVISKALKKSSAIRLSDEATAIEQSIKSFVHHEIEDMRSSLDDSSVDGGVFETIEHNIVAKADGKR